jgi:YVTN family beta-propeller protein
LPQEVDKVIFTLQSVSAVREGGEEIPLSLTAGELQGSELLGMQKILGEGLLPPGRYRGLSITVGKAFLTDEEGKVPLLVPEGPLAAEHPFVVRRGEALALFLTLSAAKPLTGGFSFTPHWYVHPQGQELSNLIGVVSETRSNLISIFNKKTLQTVGVIATGSSPEGMSLDESKGRLYVSLSGEDAVDVFDIFTGTRLGRIVLHLGDEPRELDLTPDGKFLISANYGSHTASIMDAASLYEVKRVNVGQNPVSVVVDLRGLRAYVLNQRSRTVSVIDLTQEDLAGTVPVEGSPVRGAFSRNGERFYAVCPDSPHLIVIDPPSLTVTQKIFVGTGAASIQVDTLSDLIYVGKQSEGEVLIVDPFGSMFMDRIDMGDAATFMAIDDEENALLVVDPESRRLRKVSLVSKQVLSEMELGKGAYAMAVMGER